MLLLTPWAGEWRPSEPNPVTRYVMKTLQEAFEIHVVFPARRPADYPRKELGYFLHPVSGIPAHHRRGPWAHLRSFPEFARGLYREGRRLLRTRRFHLLLGHSGFVALPLWLLGKTSGIPTVLKLFGVVRFLEFRPTPRRVLANLEHLLAYRLPVDRLLVVNDGTGGRTLAQRYGILQRFVEIPQPRPEHWHPVPDARQRLGLPENRPLLLLVSRLDLFKGLHLLPDLLAHLQTSDALTVIVGTGPLRPWLERELQRRNLLHRVRFLGYLPHERLATAYAAADLYLGLADLSTCSRPVVEALTMGLPVVAWDLLESRDCLQNSPGVLWVPPWEIPTFAARILHLLQNPDQRKRMGQAARSHALQHFPTEREVAQRIVRILLDLARSV